MNNLEFNRDAIKHRQSSALVISASIATAASADPLMTYDVNANYDDSLASNGQFHARYYDEYFLCC
jgi:hypothetical protein